MFEIGAKFKDNDERPAGRVIEIEEIDFPYILVRNIKTGRRSRVLADRFHLDDKPRRSGYSIIRQAG